MPEHENPDGWTAAAEARIEAPAAIEVIWHPAKRFHLKPFIGRSAGLAEAAAMLGVKKTAMSYWIKRLLALGLIRPVRDGTAGGRRVPRYRCLADRLVIGLSDAPLSSYEGLFDDVDARWHPQTRAALARSMARQAPWLDLHVRVDARGGLATEVQPRGAGAPPDDFVYFRGRLWLDDAERDALRRDLDALWSRYVALSDERGKPHPVLVHMVAVPEVRR